MADAPSILAQALARRLGAELVETHISWVLLLPALAYKLKKPVRLPFVDYSTPQRRLHFCEEEVRLNRRLAPSLYLGVSRVTGTPEAPDIDGAGDVLDYAVRMRRFPAGALFSERAEAGTLSSAEVDRLARLLAAFHRAAARVAPTGSGELRERALATLAGCADLFAPGESESLSSWIEVQAAVLAPLWQARRAAGHVRECHGDLHLANIFELDGEIAAFDCIEFDDRLRCIDVIEDVAFTQMDLAAHGHTALAWRFINGWLEGTGEYEGVPGLRLCLVYRALVRALVEHMRQPGGRASRYLAQALAWSRPAAPSLAITTGLPGSGKTYASQQLLEQRGAIRIRSDVERKRLYGLEPLAASRPQGIDIYTREATRRTYARLLELAGGVLRAGFPVVLDAAFLRYEERRDARLLAGSLGVPFTILRCEAATGVLRARLGARQGDASEADAAVLERLGAAAEPLREDELPFVTC